MSDPERHCANCRAAVTGPYCGACGQRFGHHAPSLAHFIAETFEAVTHADSRLWRTLAALLVHPGHLTREFFAGRRASYLPPVRLYLVVSVAFFLLAPLGRGSVVARGTDEDRAALETVAARLEQELTAATDSARRVELGRLVAGLRARLTPVAAAEVETAGVVPPASACSGVAIASGSPAFEARLRSACEAVMADGGRALVGAFAENLPLALIALLPILALVMKLLYVRSRRYYVEHLLLLVHNHAAVFVAFSLYVVIGWLAPPSLRTWLWGALLIYAIWYGYRALRVAYGESRAATLAKQGVLLTSYAVFGLLLFTLTGLYSALTL